MDSASREAPVPAGLEEGAGIDHAHGVAAEGAQAETPVRCAS